MNNENQMSEAFVAGFMSKCAEAGLEKDAAIGLLRGLVAKMLPSVGRNATRNAARIFSGRGGAASRRLLNGIADKSRSLNFLIGDNQRLAHNKALRLSSLVGNDYHPDVGAFVNQFGKRHWIDFYINNPASERANIRQLMDRVAQTGIGDVGSFSHSAFLRNADKANGLSRMRDRLRGKIDRFQTGLDNETIYRLRHGYPSEPHFV